MEYFTADTHFYHANIIHYCSRPWCQPSDFDSNGQWINLAIKKQRAYEMTEDMIKTWNETIKPEDTVNHLGDFTLGDSDVVMRLLRRLNGTINFIWGNHDEGMRAFVKMKHLYPDLQDKIRFLGDMSEIIIENQLIILCHYALATWHKKHYGSWMLCGHSHYNLPIIRKENTSLGKILDVGVDGNHFKPYLFEEIKNIMAKKPICSMLPAFSDHHQTH